MCILVSVTLLCRAESFFLGLYNFVKGAVTKLSADESYLRASSPKQCRRKKKSDWLPYTRRLLIHGVVCRIKCCPSQSQPCILCGAVFRRWPKGLLRKPIGSCRWFGLLDVRCCLLKCREKKKRPWADFFSFWFWINRLLCHFRSRLQDKNTKKLDTKNSKRKKRK